MSTLTHSGIAPELDEETEPTSVDLDITGMSCASCAARITKKLNKVDGVQATVNYATSKAHVLTTGPVSVHDLIEARARAHPSGRVLVRCRLPSSGMDESATRCHHDGHPHQPGVVGLSGMVGVGPGVGQRRRDRHATPHDVGTATPRFLVGHLLGGVSRRHHLHPRGSLDRGSESCRGRICPAGPVADGREVGACRP